MKQTLFIKCFNLTTIVVLGLAYTTHTNARSLEVTDNTAQMTVKGNYQTGTATLTANNTLLKGEAAGGDDFRQTAAEYSEIAAAYRADGEVELADIYERLAAIKRHAATLADEGRWDEIDWTEYEALNARLWELQEKK